MKYIMLSEGRYSDYLVSGLYSTEFDVNFDFLKQKQIEYAKYLGIVDDDDLSIIKDNTTIDDFFLERIYHESLVGYPMPEYGDTGNMSLFGRAKTQFDKVLESKNPVNVNLISWLCDLGVLTKVEYSEINVEFDCYV